MVTGVGQVSRAKNMTRSSLFLNLETKGPRLLLPSLSRTPPSLLPSLPPPRCRFSSRRFLWSRDSPCDPAREHEQAMLTVACG
jgi:hypothetical protein